MCAASRHLYLVPPPDGADPMNDAPPVPARAQLPETITYFMAQQPRPLVDWLMNSADELPAQLRRMGGDMYLTGLRHAERETVAERFMLCVELVRQFALYRGGRFDDEARVTFALLSTTVAERAWLQSSETPEAAQLRDMQEAIAGSRAVDEALLEQYARAMRRARTAQLMEPGLTFRYQLHRLRR